MLIVGRDLLVVGVGFVLFRGAPPIPVSRTGKFGTACLLIGIPGFLVAGMDFGAAVAFGVLAWVVTLVGLGAYYLAGAQYARIVVRMARQP